MDKRLKQIAEHYGTNLQLDKTREELDELDSAIDSFIYVCLCNPKYLDNLAEEIADVYNMLDQLVYLLNIKNNVAKHREFKIRRQLERIEARKGEGHEKGHKNES